MAGLMAFFTLTSGMLGFILLVIGFWGYQLGYDDAGNDFLKAGGMSFLAAFSFIILAMLLGWLHEKILGRLILPNAPKM